MWDVGPMKPEIIGYFRHKVSFTQKIQNEFIKNRFILMIFRLFPKNFTLDFPITFFVPNQPHSGKYFPSGFTGRSKNEKVVKKVQKDI